MLLMLSCGSGNLPFLSYVVALMSKLNIRERWGVLRGDGAWTSMLTSPVSVDCRGPEDLELVLVRGDDARLALWLASVYVLHDLVRH